MPFAGPEGAQLAGISLSSAANVVHLAVGLAGLAASRSLRLAASFGWILFAVMAGLFVWGMVALGDHPANLLAFDLTVNGVHAITAVYGIFMALRPGMQVETEDRAPLTGKHRSEGTG